MHLKSKQWLSIFSWVGLCLCLSARPEVWAQDKTAPVIAPEKRVTVPDASVKKAKTSLPQKESSRKVQEEVKSPPKVVQKPPKEKGKAKPATLYGIRPPASTDTEDKKPPARPAAALGIRPPTAITEEENKASNKEKTPSKEKTSSGADTANKKSPKENNPKPPKENNNKKTEVAEKPRPKSPPQPVESIRTPVAPTPTLGNDQFGDPKFGSSGNANVIASGLETGFLNRVVTVGGASYRYQVFVPRNWNRRQAWPVILFLHGAGERGEDGLLQTEVGIGTAIRRDMARFPAIVVFPQCRKNGFWPEETMQAQALATLEQSIREFNGDRARLYLTGISMGGFGTWALAASRAGMFAAYAPVCGALKGRDGQMMVDVKADDPYTAVARLVGQTPTWIFHGGDDRIVLTEESRKMHAALKAIGGNVQYTEYDKIGHNSWDKAYAEPKLLEWLLAQRLKR